MNTDSVLSGVGGDLRGYNLFAYCFNNPINMTDYFGCWPSLSDVVDWGKEKLTATKEWVEEKIDTAKAFFDSAVDYFTLPSQEDHYNRNENNISFPEEFDETFFKDWDNGVSANCHQFSAPNRDNVKYVSPDGKYEAIYDIKNKLVTDPKDIGTYNFVSPNEDQIGHFIKDVAPWILYGNSSDDSTHWWQRALGLIGIYV